MEWEYATEGWTFRGPYWDRWPDRDTWVRLFAAPGAHESSPDTLRRLSSHIRLPPDSEAANELEDQYWEWRRTVELGWLNEMGSAHFELVAVTRVTALSERPDDPFPTVEVFCYFKRPRLPEMPAKPSIGFRRTSPTA